MSALAAYGGHYAPGMPYPPELLNSHETVVVDNHPHWLYFLEPALGAIAALFFLAVFGFKTDGTVRGIFVTLLLLIILGLALWALVRFINWRSVEFVVTTDRVIFRSGVFAKHGIEIPLARVNNVNFSQGILERMVGAGNLMIESGGEDGQSHFTDVREPQQIQRIIHEQIEQYRQRGMGMEDLTPPPPRSATYAAATAPPAAPGPVSVADEIAKLETLFQKGTITQAQFEAQKQKLLGG
jgi:membrane protein YdbS with pleckstrin-like domain